MRRFSAAQTQSMSPCSQRGTVFSGARSLPKTKIAKRKNSTSTRNRVSSWCCKRLKLLQLAWVDQRTNRFVTPVPLHAAACTTSQPTSGPREDDSLSLTGYSAPRRVIAPIFCTCAGRRAHRPHVRRTWSRRAGATYPTRPARNRHLCTA